MKRKTIGYPKKSLKKLGYDVVHGKIEDKRLFSIFSREGKLEMQIVRVSSNEVLTMTENGYKWSNEVYCYPESGKIEAECSCYLEGGRRVTDIIRS